MIKKILGLLLLVAIILGIVFYFTQCNGSLPFGSGKDGDGTNFNSISDTEKELVVSDNEDSTTQTTQETTTELETQKAQYIEVTVSNDSYIYQNSTLTLDELMEQIKDTDLTVKLTDDKASKKAYEDLLTALSDGNIKYIE